MALIQTELLLAVNDQKFGWASHGSNPNSPLYRIDQISVAELPTDQVPDLPQNSTCVRVWFYTACRLRMRCIMQSCMY
jgi:hypothetical protein